ncbi:MAG: hypothetical protein HFACDABA_02021 [Anaerolineales bacterium]|nr:hypothetical protein [Anaerolineales bacterium]
MMAKQKIAYVSQLVYPHSSANALQAIQMADGFSRNVDTTFFIRGLTLHESKLREMHRIPPAPLRISPAYFNLLPSFAQKWYGSFLGMLFGVHPVWRRNRQQNILFVRRPVDLLFWGAARNRYHWLRDWFFIFEAHDIAGLPPEAAFEDNPFESKSEGAGGERQELLRALCAFDLIVTVTQALAENLEKWSRGKIKPVVIRHASSLPRVESCPDVKLKKDSIIIGYIGTIDQYRGVDILIRSVAHLPEGYRLRLVGRVEQDDRGHPAPWFQELINDSRIGPRIEIVGRVPVGQVTEQIDRCDILIQTASSDIIDSRYASPLKSYDYMVRGKPVAVADVPVHRELFQNEINGLFYQYDDPRHLARAIMRLVEDPPLAKRIAQNAWEQSADYNYDRRAQAILAQVTERLH